MTKKKQRVKMTRKLKTRRVKVRLVGGQRELIVVFEDNTIKNEL
jgi:hypothetical protein